MRNLIFIIIAIFFSGIVYSQNAISNDIKALKSNGISFQKTELFDFETTELHRNGLELKDLKKGTIISLKKNSIQKILQEKNEFIQLQLPVSERTELKLTLRRHEIFAPDFQLFVSGNPDQPFPFEQGLHYRGVIDGDPSSIVAISIFQDQVMGMMATHEGNFSLGKLGNNQEGRHIFYNEKDLDVNFSLGCSTSAEGPEYTAEQLLNNTNRDEDDCVRIYIEINHDIVITKGGVGLAAQFVTAIFNQSFVLYANEELSLVISEILVWNTTSPYTGINSSQMLNSYKALTEYFNGDLSHLVSFDSLYGGIAAGLSGICNSNPDLSKCFSGMRHSLANVPVFSWPVQLVTHEMGHLFGSRHTQACVWNGNNTAIDGCYPTEGTCPLPPLPPDGGTIMSYCGNFNSGSYVDFNHGFGEQPGNVIRNMVNASNNCLAPCGAAVDYCISSGTVPGNEYINKVVLGSIDNLSGNNNGYGNFIEQATSLNAGSTYTITLTPKVVTGNTNKYWRVWIDYNHDMDWYESNELVGQVIGKGVKSFSFTVPANTVTNTTRMRVSMRYTQYPNLCGTFTPGEVEDYTINISGIASPTCDDGIQNQTETGVDCGGPCEACPPSCIDGILNQGETLIDCGGPCPPCLSCDDGIQNQTETGVDCGGPCPACPPPDTSLLLGSYFETGWDGWIDGGADANRVNSPNSYEGLYSIKLADNTGIQSSMTSPTFDLSASFGVMLNFHFYATSMEAGERFYIGYNRGTGDWGIAVSFISGTHFNNNTHYSVAYVLPGFRPTEAATFRLVCDASDNNDQVFIDAVTVTHLVGSEYVEPGLSIVEKEAPQVFQPQTEASLLVYPNPVNDVLHIDFTGEVQSIRILAVDGRHLDIIPIDRAFDRIDVQQLPGGIYFLSILSANEWVTTKFIKI